jgi:flagellar basal body-associated protein FliL
MEKKGNFFVLLIIIAVLTLAVAVLAAFIFLVGFNQPSAAADDGAAAQAAADAAAASAVEPPDEASLTTMKLFADKQFFNLKSTDPNKLAVCIVDVSVKYFTKVDGIKDVAAKMTLNEDNLKEIVSTYFQQLTLEDLERIETRAKAKDDLKRELNEFLISTIDKASDRQKVKEIIYEVVFSGWNYQ